MMRKLLVLMATVALALGAQAALIEYSYNLSLVTIPISQVQGTVQNVTGYLVDKSVTGSVTTYDNKAVMVKFELTKIGTSDEGVQFYYNYTPYDMGGYTKADSTIKTYTDPTLLDSGGNVDIATFKAPSIMWEDMGGTEYQKNDPRYTAALNDYLRDNLETILVADVYNAETKEWQRQEFVLGVTVNEGYKALGSNSSYNAIPEPTSGMLVLLGFAGLALRRKRAA